jgi:hypothetical protein
MSRKGPVSVKVIAYAPTAFFHCQHCEITFNEMGIGERLRRQDAAESLPEDLGRDFQILSEWIRGLIERYGPKIHVRVVDAASMEGFLASLRYRVLRYPAVIVDGRDKRVGPDLAAVEPVIERRLAEAG